MRDKKKKMAYDARFVKENYKRYYVQFRKREDKDLIKRVSEEENYNEYFRDLVRKDCEK